MRNSEMNEHNEMINKPVLIIKNSLSPKLTYTFLLEEDDIKRIIEEAEGAHPYSYLEPIRLKYRKEYVGEIGESPRLEIRSVDYESFVWQTTATPIVLENNVIELDIYMSRPMLQVSLSSPNILVEISIEDLKNKVLRTSIDNLKLDFGDGVFGEVYLKVPINLGEPDPVKIVSSNLLYNQGLNGETVYFKHTCTPIYTNGLVTFLFEHETLGKPIQFLSNTIDLCFIDFGSRYNIYDVIKISKNLLKSNYGITIEPLFGESNRELFLNVVDLDYNFNFDNIPLVCSDISKEVGKYLSTKWGNPGFVVKTRYIDDLKRFSIEFVIRARQ